MTSQNFCGLCNPACPFSSRTFLLISDLAILIPDLTRDLLPVMSSPDSPHPRLDPPHPGLDPPHPGLDSGSPSRHVQPRPGISLREGPPHGPSVHFSPGFFARRSTPWTFRTKEGIPSRGTPLRFAPFRPLPFRNAPSDDVAAVGPSPYPCAGVHKPPGGYPFRRPRFSSLLSPVFKDEPRFKTLSSLFWANFKDETRFCTVSPPITVKAHSPYPGLPPMPHPVL